MKRCTKCGELKHSDSFNRRKAASDGLRSECRDCQKQIRILYQDVSNAKFRTWARNNRDKRNATCRQWSQRNSDKVYEYVKTYRSKNPHYANERAGIRRARVKGLAYEHIDTYCIYLMPKGLCGLCYLPVDYSLPYPDPQSPTIDHITAIANGGPHLYENTQLAHAICNWRKNDSS